MQRVMMVGCLALGMATGCTSMKTTSTSATPEPVTAAPAPPSAALPAPPIQVPPAKAAAAVPPATVDGPTAAAAAPARPKKPKPPVATVPPKMAAAGSPSAPVPAPAATHPTLDLASLQQRLRETHAIGVFTKLSLKNEVDDLLDEFRDLYKQPNTRPTPQMRQHFDVLLLKVLTLLQDSDPPLAAAISSSKEAIWGILADPEKFAKI
jgi:hypothetical protein